MAKKGMRKLFAIASPLKALVSNESLTRFEQIAKSRTIAVRLISMALTGYYKTLVRPRQHRPLSMLKYDPVGTSFSI